MPADLVWPRKMQYVCDLLDQARNELQRLAAKQESEVASDELRTARSLINEANTALYETATRRARQEAETDAEFP